jgi:hypothetical protein
MITLTSNTIIEILGCRVLCWAGFSSAEWFGTEFRQFALYFFHGTEFRVVFSSAEGFGREFWEYSSIFVSTERNSELFSLPLKCSKGNSESLLLFLFNGTEFQVVFSSAEGFGTKFRGFLFRRTAGIPSEITICSFYSVFRGIIFLSEIPNPNWPLSSTAMKEVQGPDTTWRRFLGLSQSCW